jgi:tetratricopeptide (TPR) repeat protein
MKKQEDLIEKYLLDDLSPEEELVVKELLLNNVDFEKEISFHDNLKKAIKKDDDDNFRNLISALESRAKMDGNLSRRSYVKCLAVASIVLLLGISYFLTKEKKATGNELFASYFEPYRNVIQPLERGGEQQDEKSLAFLAYEKGDYNKAISLFSNLYLTTQEPYYLFYKANALLKLERAKEAVPLLLEHLKTKDSLTEKTNWYLALAYLKLEDKAKAEKILEKVIADGNYKASEAQKLLKAFK